MKKQKQEKSIEKVSVKTLVLSIAVVFIVAVAVLLGAIYTQRDIFENPALLSVAKVLHVPVVVIDTTHAISINTLAKNRDAMKKFYETQDYGQVGLRVDFSTEEGKKRLLVKERGILNKLLEDRAVQLIAKKEGIAITQAEINKRVSDALAESGSGKNIEEDLRTHYGMTLADFKEYIVLPDMYREKLSAQADQDFSGDNALAQEKAQKALDELNGGGDFGEIAKKYSQGASAAKGGEIGWVKKADVIPQLAEYVFSAKQPQQLQVVESDLGYHIAQVLEKKKSDNEDVVRIRQIFIRKKGFADWLDGQMQSMSVRVPLKGFMWDPEKKVILFSDPEMEKFERDDQHKFEGDASML